MISKLYDLNKLKLNQNISKKQQIKSKIHKIDLEVEDISNTLNTASVEKYGAISDFRLLSIHKDTLKHKIKLFNMEKQKLNNDLLKYDKEIMKYQKELEKYDYLLKEQKKEKFKKEIKQEEEIASEYIQAKFIKNMLNKQKVQNV
jgi:chromosome segregation ATPase